MKSNKIENKIQTTERNKQLTGYNTNVMPVLGKTGEYIYYFLPGEITVIEHVNRIKGLLGLDYTPKAPILEKRIQNPSLGLRAKVRLNLSQDGQWVTLYLPGSLGKISNHKNAYFHILNIPYEKKAKAS